MAYDKKYYDQPKVPILELNGKPTTATTLSDIVEWVMSNNECNAIAYFIIKDHEKIKAVLNELCFQYLKKPNPSSLHNLLLKGEFYFVFSKALKIMFAGNSTYTEISRRYYRLHSDYNINDEIPDLHSDEEEKIERIEKELNQEAFFLFYHEYLDKLSFYERKLWDLFIKYQSVIPIVRETKIPKTEVYNVIKKIQADLRAKRNF